MARKLNQYASIKQDELLLATYHILRNPEIPDVFKKDFLKNNTIQIWSEHYQSNLNSKIIGNKYLSEGAYVHYMNTKSRKGLHHEHVTTKNFLFNKQFGNRYLEVEIDELKYWMDSCAFACVITNEEDKEFLGGKLKQNLPEEFYQKNHPLYMKKWARYLKAEFTDIWEVRWENKIPIKIGRPDFTETV